MKLVFKNVTPPPLAIKLVPPLIHNTLERNGSLEHLIIMNHTDLSSTNGLFRNLNEISNSITCPCQICHTTIGQRVLATEGARILPQSSLYLRVPGQSTQVKHMS